MLREKDDTMSLFKHVHACMCAHTTHVVDSRPHSTHLLEKRVLFLTEIVHFSNVRVLPTVQVVVSYKE